MGKPEHIDPAALISALHTRDPEETKAAISALEVLANQSPEKIIPPLVDEIARAEDPFTGAALRVLRKTRKQSGKYAPQLAAHFQKLPPLHKVGMLQTIQEIDPEGPRLQELISEAFKDPDPLVRKEAVQAMTRNRERMQGYRDSILAALKDENVDVRIAALRIVTAYVELLAGAESRLLELTKDPDEQMRLHATANIGLLRTLPPESLDTLAAALKDKEPKVRMAAVMSLHNLALRKKANSAPILEAAAKTEEDYRTKEYLQNVLEDLGVRKRIRETAQPSGPPAPPAGHGMPPGFELNRE
jgi:hypothetical protein